jgi:hypothetical protein
MAGDGVLMVDDGAVPMMTTGQSSKAKLNRNPPDA